WIGCDGSTTSGASPDSSKERLESTPTSKLQRSFTTNRWFRPNRAKVRGPYSLILLWLSVLVRVASFHGVASKPTRVVEVSRSLPSVNSWAASRRSDSLTLNAEFTCTRVGKSTLSFL